MNRGRLSFRPRATLIWRSGSMPFSLRLSLWRQIALCREINRISELKSTRWPCRTKSKCSSRPSSTWSSLPRYSHSYLTLWKIRLLRRFYRTSRDICFSQSTRNITNMLSKRPVKLWPNLNASRAMPKLTSRCADKLKVPFLWPTQTITPHPQAQPSVNTRRSNSLKRYHVWSLMTNWKQLKLVIKRCAPCLRTRPIWAKRRLSSISRVEYRGNFSIKPSNVYSTCSSSIIGQISIECRSRSWITAILSCSPV